MKHYRLYDRFSTCFVLGGMGLLYVLTLGLCTFFIKHFVFDSLTSTGKLDLSIIPLIIVFASPSFVIIPVVSRKSSAISRYFLRCSFTKEGICCSGFLWGSFLVPWRKIRTYGLHGFNSTNVSLVFLFFSTEQEYYNKEKITQISANRIVFQLRDDIICPLLEHMPPDMKTDLEKAIKDNRDIYVQRRAN